MYSDYLKISFLMMRAKPVRSVLSLLGILIGVLALVLILGIREGLQRQLSDVFRTQGAKVVYVHPGFDPINKRVGRISFDDLAVLRTIPGVFSAQPRFIVEQDVRSPTGSLRSKIVSIDEQFVTVNRIALVRGRNLVGFEAARRAPVCLLTGQAVRKLFPQNEPIGAAIDVNGISFQIIGVVNWDGAASQRTSLNEADVFVPSAWLSAASGNAIVMAEIRVDPRLTSKRALDVVRDALSRGHKERESLYFIRSLDQFMEKNKEMSDRVMTGLLGIAGISLLVGGIGVANVMVTSVTERTREIGIRKALGARRTDILFQFLMESIVLSGTGGLLAVIVGALGMSLLPKVISIPIPIAIPFGPAMGCLAMTMTIGLIAGLYPASRAAALSPVEALRYE